jgi:Cytochrome C oxidase, cbb3-type, subunit III
MDLLYIIVHRHSEQEVLGRPLIPHLTISDSKIPSKLLTFAILGIITTIGCDVELRKSDAELGLNPQQAAGRRIYDQYCDRCHAPYSSRGRRGPSMKHVFKQPYLPMSGMPANDDRVTDVIKMGRNKMPAYGQVLTQQQIEDLLAYLHTL